MRTVILNWPQMMIATTVATMRNVSNIHKGRRERYGAAGTVGIWDRHIIGAQSEFAVALALNLSWDGAVGDFDAKDVGGLVEVRACETGRRLILHRDDDDSSPYVLVYARPPEFDLVGWIYGRDGKREELWTELQKGRPAFVVEVAMLRPMDELVAMMERRI